MKLHLLLFIPLTKMSRFFSSPEKTHRCAQTCVGGWISSPLWTPRNTFSWHISSRTHHAIHNKRSTVRSRTHRATMNNHEQQQPSSNCTRARGERSPTECRVCRGLAIYSYVGAIVCAPCKMFFRRHAEKPQVRSAMNGIIAVAISLVDWFEMPWRWSMFVRSIEARAIYVDLVEWRNASPSVCKWSCWGMVKQQRQPEHRRDNVQRPKCNWEMSECWWPSNNGLFWWIFNEAIMECSNEWLWTHSSSNIMICPWRCASRSRHWMIFSARTSKIQLNMHLRAILICFWWVGYIARCWCGKHCHTSRLWMSGGWFRIQTWRIIPSFSSLARWSMVMRGWSAVNSAWLISTRMTCYCHWWWCWCFRRCIIKVIRCQDRLSRRTFCWPRRCKIDSLIWPGIIYVIDMAW